MNLMEAIQARHSVRRYQSRPLPEEIIRILQKEAAHLETLSGLKLALAVQEPDAFRGLLPCCGNFRNVENYFIISAPDLPNPGERAGYYGESLVLLAQTLGLNTCWAAMTFRRRAVSLSPGFSLCCVIALGYGETAGVPHRSKPMSALCRTDSPAPQWFLQGMEAAMLAPTSMNRQNFLLTRRGSQVHPEAKGLYAGIDRGIICRHFEIGAGTENFTWN